MADGDIFDDIMRFLKDPVDDGLPIESTPSADHWNSPCRHRKVLLDDVAKKVTCRECEKELDPFWYLSLLAKEWKLRSYHDEAVVGAARLLEQDRLNKKGRGYYFSRPSKGPGVVAWDTFVIWLDALGEEQSKGLKEPFAIYHSSQWMMSDGMNGHYSISYAEGYLRQKAIEDQV